MGTKRKRINKTGQPGDRLFKVLLILLSLVLVVILMITGTKINRESYRYYSKPNELLWTIRNGNYPDALTSMYDNIAQGETPEKNAEYAAPYAILEYYEAASLLKAYTNVDSGADPVRGAELASAAERCKAGKRPGLQQFRALIIPMSIHRVQYQGEQFNSILTCGMPSSKNSSDI